jgi:hypothetical protein
MNISFNFFKWDVNDIHHFQRWMLQMAIICMPLGFFPLKFPLVGNSVPSVCLLVGYIGYLIEKIISPKLYTRREKFAIIFLGVLVAWNFFSEIIGINTYQFYQFLDINQDEKLTALYWNLNQFIVIDSLFLTKLWLTFLSFRGAILNCLFGYFIVLWTIHLYEENSQQAFEDITRAIHILCIILSIYSVFEVGYLLGNYFCKDFLTHVNPLFMKIAYLNDWWPPLLWTNLQVRSMFAEPSFFGMFLAMALPMLMNDFYKKYNIRYVQAVYCMLYVFMVMLLVMSKARTAAMLFLGEMLLFWIWQLFINKKDWGNFSRCVGCTILAVAFGLLCTFHFQAIDIKVDQSNNTSVQSYVSQNITSVVGNQRSNSARKANTISMLKVGFQNPAFGVGTDLAHEYIAKNLTAEDLNNPEVKKWTSDMNEKGPLKSGYPILNQVAWSFATQGIIGAILFLLPIGFILYKIFLVRNELLDSKLVFSLIAFLGLTMAFFSNAAQIEYFILCGLMICLVQDETSFNKRRYY